MADILPQTLSRPLSGLSRLPAHRQFGMVLGLAVVMAVGAAMLMWGFKPPYQVLLGSVGGTDAAEAIAVLERNSIPHRLDERTGALMVPANRVHEARLGIATEGLPREQGFGFELLEQDQGLGTSRLLETARHQRALEGELARSIVTLDSVAAARVHLALPRQSVFVRERSEPSASVIVNLNRGRQLDDAKIAGIVHMVAASVPELEADRVTVVDQRGTLLSHSGAVAGAAGAHAQQLDYTRKIEEGYRQRVEDILAPLVGSSGMRVQVTAEVDFTQIESTREIYDPDPVLRSEQVSDEQSVGGLVGGVPGTLTNQPPGAGVVSFGAANPSTPGGATAAGAGTGAAAEGNGATLAGATAADTAATATPVNRNRRSTRNYEVDRTIDHVRQAPATLSRLFVAVVVDDRQVVADDGTRSTAPRDAEEMAHLTSLIREAVGLDEARGDRLNVVNASFRGIEPPEAFPAVPLWEEPWVRELVRYGLSALGLLLLVLLVLRPALKNLAALPSPSADGATLGAPGAVAVPGLPSPGAAADATALVAGAALPLDPAQSLNRARKIATEDPRLAAQVVRQWMSDDGK